MFKVIRRHFDFVLLEYIAVGYLAIGPVGPDDVVDAIDALQIHRNALDAIGDLAGNRITLESAYLLEIGELSHLHAV